MGQVWDSDDLVAALNDHFGHYLIYVRVDGRTVLLDEVDIIEADDTHDVRIVLIGRTDHDG